MATENPQQRNARRQAGTEALADKWAGWDLNEIPPELKDRQMYELLGKLIDQAEGKKKYYEAWGSAHGQGGMRENTKTISLMPLSPSVSRIKRVHGVDQRHACHARWQMLHWNYYADGWAGLNDKRTRYEYDPEDWENMAFLQNWVGVEVEDKERETDSGLVIPDIEPDKPAQFGRVVKTPKSPCHVRKGDRVAIGTYASTNPVTGGQKGMPGIKIKVGDTDYLQIREDDIGAISQ